MNHLGLASEAIVVPSGICCSVCSRNSRKVFSYQGYEYYQCVSCRHVVTLPYPSDEAIFKHYSKQFEHGNYNVAHKNKIGRASPFYQYLNLLNSWYSRSQNGSVEGKKILDIGCFTGELLEVLEKAGAIVTGIELQEEAARIAKNKISGTVINQSVFDAHLEDRSFDAIVLSGVIEHVKDPRNLLKRSCQLLKAEGILLIQTPNSSSWLARVFRKYWPPYQPVEHIHLFSKCSLNFLVKEFGGTLVHFQNHWKKLPIDYVYNMFATFGPEFHKLLKPFYKICPKFILKRSLPFYGGEMLVLYQFSKNNK